MKTALLLIATGEKYQQYVRPLLDSANKFFVPHTPILWTDQRDKLYPAREMYIADEGYPNTTLHRYHTFLKAENYLSSFDYIWYTDIDMLFVSPVKEEDIISDGITATLHPGYVGGVGTPERRPESTSYIPIDANNRYFCGGINGGTSKAYLTMAKILRNNIDIDTERGITPIWHDESAINKFLYERPPSRILGPEFCYPEGCNGNYAGTQIGPPKLIALTKKDRS